VRTPNPRFSSSITTNGHLTLDSPAHKVREDEAVVVIALHGTDAVDRWQAAVGPEDPVLAKQSKLDAGTLRAIHGTSRQANLLACTRHPNKAVREASFWFGGRLRPSTEMSRTNRMLIPRPMRRALVAVSAAAPPSCYASILASFYTHGLSLISMNRVPLTALMAASAGLPEGYGQGEAVLLLAVAAEDVDRLLQSTMMELESGVPGLAGRWATGGEAALTALTTALSSTPNEAAVHNAIAKIDGEVHSEAGLGQPLVLAIPRHTAVDGSLHAIVSQVIATPGVVLLGIKGLPEVPDWQASLLNPLPGEQWNHGAMTQALREGPLVLLALSCVNGHAVLDAVVGGNGNSPAQARSHFPASIRSQFGLDDVDCGAFSSRTPRGAFCHLSAFFSEAELCRHKGLEGSEGQSGASPNLWETTGVLQSFLEAPPVERSLCVVAGDILLTGHLPKVIKTLRHAGFTLDGLRMVHASQVDTLMDHTASESPSKACVILALARPNAVKKLAAVVGERRRAGGGGRKQGGYDSSSLRSSFDRSESYTNIGFAPDAAAATAVLDEFFPCVLNPAAGGSGDPLVDATVPATRVVAKRPATLVESICVVVLPRLVLEGSNLDQCLDRILRDGYRLVQCRTTALTQDQAEAYVALSGQRAGVAEELAGGSAIVLGLEKTNAVTQFRTLNHGKGRPESAPAMGRMAVAGNDPVWQLRHASLQQQHGDAVLSSNTVGNARKELAFFFEELMYGEDAIAARPV